MALSAADNDARLDSETAADLLKLNQILEYCDSTTIGALALRRSPSVRNNYAQALSQLDRVTLVFDSKLYQGRVLLGLESEDGLYEELLLRAKALGVPDSQPPVPEFKEQPRTQADAVVGTAIMEDDTTPTTPEPPLPGVRSPNIDTPLTRFSSPDKMLRGIAALVPSSASLSRSPNPSSSVSSFLSGNSHASSLSSKRQNTRRDSLMQYFRRDTSRRGTPSLVGTPRSFSQASRRTEADSLYSVETRLGYSLQSSCMQSPPTSIRSSISSSLEVHQPFSFRERRALDAPLKTQRFLDLQQKCVAEAQRFLTFSDHQRSALPLIFGRNRLYMSERREVDIKKLKQKHEAALEELENRHLEQELTETERLRTEVEEFASKNATALKHVNRRISLLGEDATEEHLKRLEEEVTAMERLQEEHKREFGAMIRTQKRERLNLQRQLDRDVAQLRREMKKEFEDASRAKRNELETNMRRLETVIHERKSRLAAKWYIELQIFKQETGDLRDSIFGPLPLRLLGLPSGFE